jgi:hypothetical protein
MGVIIVAEKENYLLVARGNRIARGNRVVVLERRNNQLYNCHCGKRGGIPADDLSGLSEIVDEGDWVDLPTGYAAFEEAVAQWSHLAEHMR